MGFMKRQAREEEKDSTAAGFLPRGGLHPPEFLHSQRLLDWPRCWLELRCPRCKAETLYPTKLLAGKYGNRSFDEVLTRVKCKHCGVPPATVFLCAGQRRRNGGRPPDWAIEL